MKKPIANHFKNSLFVTFDYNSFSKKTFIKVFKVMIILCFLLSVNVIVNGQAPGYGHIDTYPPVPWGNNGCFGANEFPSVYQESDQQRPVTSNPPPVQATFTGGKAVGSNLYSPCAGMISYGTTRHVYGSLTNMQDKIKVSFSRPIRFGNIFLEGRYPQRVKVSVGGQTIEVDLVRNPYDETLTEGIKTVYASDFPSSIYPQLISEFTVSAVDPDWNFGIAEIDFGDSAPRSDNPGGPPPNYCNVETKTRPAPENLSAHDWTMHAEVSDADGLVLSNVRLKGRLMAERISVPYFSIHYNNRIGTQGELKPDGMTNGMRSRLVAYKAEPNNERLIIKATYAIDNIENSQICLSITQNYEFEREGLNGYCTPHSPIGYQLSCSRWRASVTYDFKGNGGEVLQALKVAQRSHFKTNDFARNSVGLFRDCDNSPLPTTNPPSIGGGCLPFEGLLFKEKLNPLFSEHYSEVAKNGQQTKQWDNLHQTYLGSVSEPPFDNLSSSRFTAAGCPECVHSHWRWGNILEQLGAMEILYCRPAASKTWLSA